MAQERKNGNSDKSMTAVEWLVRKVNMSRALDSIPAELVIKAKQMEKEQIMKAFLDGKVNYRKDWADQHYNKTYGKDSNEPNA